MLVFSLRGSFGIVLFGMTSSPLASVRYHGIKSYNVPDTTAQIH